MSIIQGSAHTSAGGGGYQIERSLRFNSADSAYLSRTPASAGNRKTWTWSGWIKKCKNSENHNVFIGRSNGTNYDQIRWNSDDSLYFFGQNGGADSYRRNTTPVYRDNSSWYHLVGVFDSTNATAANRVKLYVNGVEVTAFASSSNPSLNYDSYVNATNVHFIGGNNLDGMYSNQYMTEINFIDGQALTPSDFGETDSNTGVWKPKKFSGTYGTNGFYLKFLSSYSGASFSADYLVVAGGGGGGAGYGGGGGAGGYRELTSQTLSTYTSYTVTIGGGGAGSGSYAVLGTSGSNSVFSTTTSNGGGGGHSGGGSGSEARPGANGGSGGGGAYGGAGGSGNTPSTSPSQGSNGGSGSTSASSYGSGGGGGAGGTGANGTSTAGGNGGNGTASSITGSSVTRGGGGGGGSISGTAGTGGTGGGGNAGNGSGSGQGGGTNLGGGGGGATFTSSLQSGGNGGSGVVIIKIPNTYSANFTSGVTFSMSTAVSGYKIYTVTATSTTSETVTFV